LLDHHFLECKFALFENQQVQLKKSEVPGSRVYIDISIIADISAGNKLNWMLVVDEALNRSGLISYTRNTTCWK
jgi:hypothetical protein